MILLPSWDIYTRKPKNESLSLIKELISECNCWVLEFKQHEPKKAGAKIEGTAEKRSRLIEMIKNQGMEVKLNADGGMPLKNNEDDEQWYFMIHFDLDKDAKLLNLDKKV